MTESVVFLLTGFLAGSAVIGVVWAVIASSARKVTEHREEKRTVVMSSIGQLCAQVDAVIADYKLGTIDNRVLRDSLRARLDDINLKLKSGMDHMDPFYVKYVEQFISQQWHIVLDDSASHQQQIPAVNTFSGFQEQINPDAHKENAQLQDSTGISKELSQTVVSLKTDFKSQNVFDPDVTAPFSIAEKPEPILPELEIKKESALPEISVIPPVIQDVSVSLVSETKEVLPSNDSSSLIMPGTDASENEELSQNRFIPIEDSGLIEDDIVIQSKVDLGRLPGIEDSAVFSIKKPIQDDITPKEDKEQQSQIFSLQVPDKVVFPTADMEGTQIISREEISGQSALPAIPDEELVIDENQLQPLTDSTDEIAGESFIFSGEIKNEDTPAVLAGNDIEAEELPGQPVIGNFMSQPIPEPPVAVAAVKPENPAKSEKPSESSDPDSLITGDDVMNTLDSFFKL